MRVFSIPLTTRFRGTDHREGVLVEGSEGWGEFSPFPEYPPQVCARWLDAAMEAATTPWPAPVRDRIPVNVTVPAIDAERAGDLVAASGCATAKVKVAQSGQRASDDIARVAAVRDALGPTGRIRVDVNGGWDVDTAADMIGRLQRFDLEYVEQPCPTLEDMARLRRRVAVPLAADESIRTAGDPLRVVGLEAADVAVLKVQPLGGVWPALRVAEATGLPVVVSSALETSIGIAAGVALAAALPVLDYACGLATVTLLGADVVADPLLPVDGFIEVRRPPVDPDRLAAVEVTGEAADHWRRRVAAAEAAR